MPDEYDALIDSLGSPAKKARPPLDYRALYQDVGKKYGVDPDLLYNQAKQESVNFNPHYVYGPGKSPKGAAGLSQFMPETAKQYGLYVGKGRDDRFNPRLAADAQARMMKDLIAKHGDATLALAAYNSGHNKTSEQARRSAQRIPETRGYVQKIAPKGDKYDQLLDGIGDAPAPQNAAPQFDPYDDLLDSLDAPAGKKPSPFARVKAGVGAAQVDDWRPRSMRSQKKLFETPKPSPRTGTESLLETIGGREKRGEDIQNILEGVTGAVAGTFRQAANVPEVGMQLTGLKALGVPNPVSAQIRRPAEYLERAVAENEAARPAPTTFAGNVRRGVGKGIGASAVEMPKLLLGGTVLKAANLPVQGALSRAEEGIPGVIKGAAGGLVYHYGGALTGKAFSGVSPYLAKVGNSLVWIAGPVAEQQIIAKATGSEAPNLAQSIGENIPFGIMAGMGARGKVRVKTPRGERDATEADLPKILKKELEVVPPEREAAPSVPERPETISAQLDAVKQGTRSAVLITPGTQRPALPRGMRAEKTKEGILYYDPLQISPYTIRAKIADGTFGELLGHVEPKSPATTEAVVARTPEGTEIQSSAVSPENVGKQAELMAEQYPEAKIRTGGPELAADVIAKRVEPQRFYHTQYGNVVKAPDQTGARKGKTRVYVEGNPEEIHYPKTVDLRGRGNERMVPLKESASEPAVSPVQPAEIRQQQEGVRTQERTPPSPETVRVEPMSLSERAAQIRAQKERGELTDFEKSALEQEQQALKTEDAELRKRAKRDEQRMAEGGTRAGGMGDIAKPLSEVLAERRAEIASRLAEIESALSPKPETTSVEQQIDNLPNVGEKSYTKKPPFSMVEYGDPTLDVLAKHRYPDVFPKDAPVKNVPLDSLTATQESLRTSVLKEYAEGKGSPKAGDDVRVIRFQGTNYLVGGHHRATVDKLRGNSEIAARFLDLDAGKTTSVEQGVELKTIKGDEAQTPQLSPAESRKVDRPAIAGEEVPPVPEGFTRFYRADSSETTEPTGKGWVANAPEYVSEKYGKGQMGSETVWYRDVPNREIDAEYGDHRSVSVLDKDALDSMGGTKAKLFRRIEQPSSSKVASPTALNVEKSLVPEPKVSKQPIKEVSNVVKEAEVSGEPEIGGRLGAGRQGAPARETAPAPPKERRGTKGREFLVTGERSDITLSQFVRKRGGIVPHKMFAGELDRLRPKGTGTTGLINQNNISAGRRVTADRMMEQANEAGFKDPATGEKFENVGDFLYAVELDATGIKKNQALTGAEIDFETEYRKHVDKQVADQKEHDNAVKSADALVSLLEGGRGGELFDKIVEHNATSAEQAEFRNLARRKFIRNSDIEDLIAEAQAESVRAAPEGERAAKPERAEQLGFVQEGLTQESARLPPKEVDQRARLIQEEKQRQRERDPERAAALDTLAELRRKGMTVDEYARQGSLLGEAPSAEKIALLRNLERQAGYLNPKLAKEGVYEPATTPVLKQVENATLNAERQRPTLSQYARKAKSYVQRALIAEFTPLRELEQKLYGDKSVPVVNLARKFEQVAGAPAKAEADIIDFRRNVVDPIRKSADDFNSYLFLKRVEDRLMKEPERKRVADWTVEKAREGLSELEAKVGADTYKELAKAGKVYQKEMDKALRLQVESGRMSEDLYNTIKESNDFYAPFKVLRYIEDADIVRGSGRRIATTQELAKKIKGIDSEDFQLGNILQASAEQIVRSRILAEKNLKMLELDKLADLDPKGELMRRVTEDKPRPDQGKEFVRFLKDGKEQILEVDTVVADAVQGLNPKQAGLITKVMMFTRKPLQIGATSANASFQAVNLFFADLPRQALVSRYGLRNVKDVYQFPMDWGYSIFSSIKGNFGRPNQLYMDWLRSGAANSTIQRELTPESFRPTLGIAKPGVKHLGRSVLDSVAKFSNAIEETSKILGLKRGMTIEGVAKMSPAERKAAMEKIAAEVRNYSGSPDFARKGSETRDLNLLFMFFNARLQGVASDVTRLGGRTGTKEATAAWVRLGVGVALPSTLLAIVNNLPENKEDYEKIPEWEKSNYFMIPRSSYFKNEDTGEETRDYWRIPKRGVVQLIANTAESAVQFGFEREPKAAKTWAVDMVENLSPLNIEGRNTGERVESVFGSTNPALKLPAETLMNRDTFRHRNIVPEYMRKAAPAEQYRESTPRGYRMAGKVLGVSPLQLEHAVEGATGSAASQFSIRPQQEGRSVLGRFPLTRRFVRSGSTATDDDVTQEQTDHATKQLLRRRERQAAIKKYRAGEISKADLDRMESEGVLTESDTKRVEKEGTMSSRQARFAVAAPNVALDRFERMDERQRNEVLSLMEKKAYALLNSEALTDAQKEEFRVRIEALGIMPRNPRAKSSSGFKSAFGKRFGNQFATQ